ncbi:MAG: diacylglycerol kinase family lipid kinase [Eubacterium sp.]|nr:diacylglycerol kinase family lipid kinase [Eubacterium sp.]
MKKLLFVINPTAGKGKAGVDLFDMTDIFTKAGYDTVVHPVQRQEYIIDYIAEVGGDYDMIVCAGGDGTLDKTATGFMKLKEKTDKEITLGYIPCGSTNDYARSLGISLIPLKAAEQIAAGRPVPIDLGMMNGDPFIYIAAFGLFTNVSYNTSQELKNALGHSAYILEGMKELANIKVYKIEASFDDRLVTGEYIYGQVTNTLSVGGFKMLANKEVIFNDGLFECILIRTPRSYEDLKRIFNALITGENDDELMYYEKARNVRIKSSEPISWTIDGEFGGETDDARIEVLNRKIPMVLEGTSGFIDV